jgi:F-type H+-transporting ATPase subunit a
MPTEGPKPFLEPLAAHMPAALKPWVDLGVLYSFVAMALLLIVAYLATRRMEMRAEKASKLQMAVEWAYEGFRDFILGVMGPEGERFLPLLGTMFFYILIMNMMGMIPGFEAPTSRLSMTGGLALISFFCTQYFGARKHGARYFLRFLGPQVDPPILRYFMMPVMFPVEVISEIARPVSLALRLFGNVFGDDTSTVQFLLLGVALTSIVYVPVPLHAIMLVIFDPLFAFIQALIFVVLTAAYISGAIEEAH